MIPNKEQQNTIIELHEQFESWTIDSIEPSDKGDVGLKFNLSFGFHNHATLEVAYSGCEGCVFVNGKEVEDLQ